MGTGRVLVPKSNVIHGNPRLSALRRRRDPATSVPRS